MKLTQEQNEELKSLLGMEWRTRKGEVDQKMVEFCMKKDRYIYLNGEFIKCCENKPSIDSTLYYDDTTEGPGNSFNAFRIYNIHNIPEQLKPASYGETLITSAHYSNGSEKLRCFYYSENIEADKGRIASAEELKAINEARKEVADDYEKRLKTYYKKYSKNIRSSGYWAER